MMKIESIASKTRAIIRENEITAKKKFGQNFLADVNVLNEIVEAAGVSENDFIIEIGPGLGSLTEQLAQHAAKVCAVEIDGTLVRLLRESLSRFDNVEILHSDILKTDINKIIENSGYESIKVVANLPYYITTPIIMELLENKYKIKGLTIMVQKEVGDRLLAKENCKDYGAISLAVQYYSRPQMVMRVAPECFVPRPNVDSCVVKLDILEIPPVLVSDEDFLFKLIKSAFSQRRKTLVNCIYNLMGLDLSKEEIEGILISEGINEKIRGEALSLQQFAVLSERFAKGDLIHG